MIPLSTQNLYKQAAALSWFTVVYNLAEGLISTYFGVTDDTLALFGFGADSFIEVISGLGVLQMVTRITSQPTSPRTEWERRALRITGVCFYVLAVSLIVGAGLNTGRGQRPENTGWGVVISLVSIGVMSWLSRRKISIGERLHSSPIVADGRCTQVCVYMSVVLLTSSLLYQVTHIAYVDAIGAVGLAYFSFKEGKEALAKADATGTTCNDHCCQ